MPRIALAVAGVPYDFYLADDLLADGNVKLPKVVMVTDPTTLAYDQFVALRRRCAADGRVLVWFGRPGVYATDGAKIDDELGMERRPEGDGKWIVAGSGEEDPLMKGVQGLFTAWYPYYADGIVFPGAWSPKGWKTLACYDKTSVPAVSVRRTDALTEVYIANPGQVPTAFIRNLAHEAGFEPLLETDDISGYGSGLFYVLAQRTGEKAFRLPKGRMAGEVLEGPAVRRTDTGYSVSLRRNEIFVLVVN